MSLLHVPEGHGTAAAEPPVQYAPCGHSAPAGVVEPDRHANPANAVHGLQRLLLLDDAYVPAAHGKHAADKAWPTRGLKVPIGQGTAAPPAGQ